MGEKKRRGRPSFGFDDLILSISEIYPDVRSKRGKQNLVYQVHALNAIDDMGRPDIMKFFCNTDTNKTKASALVEIGRLWDDSLIQKMAMQVYDNAMQEGEIPAKQMEKIIRMVRRDWQRNIKFDI